MKTSIIFILATLLLSASCMPHVFNHHDIITYPPSMDDRPHMVRSFSDEEYNKWCTPHTGKRTIIFNSKFYLGGMSNLNLFNGTELDTAWQEAVACGRNNAYDHTDIGKVWSKALTNAAKVSTHPLDLGLVSAAVNHITGIYPCANFEATTDLLFTLAEPEDRKRDAHMFHTMAEQFVSIQVENFDASRDCPFSYPKVLPGAFNEHFDCSAPFIPESSMDIDVDENQKPNTALEEVVQHIKKSVENCGHLNEHDLAHFAENYEWFSDISYQFYEVYYFDVTKEAEYHIYLDKDFNRGGVFFFDPTTEGENVKVFAHTEYCPVPWDSETADSPLEAKIKGLYNKYTVEFDGDAGCVYQISDAGLVEEFFYIPVVYLVNYFKEEGGVITEEFYNFGSIDGTLE